ncbi:glycosyltransferase family 39 protein [Nakamurella aerolata]|uniref:DUF2029 domain-containing protein n=1 Tax=Nakamurella aerolata TaxID=1656892 RepID=A0A849A601_9ACTN|nr:glycosyltransferase family 39 protein [Nakamurella aerolata]NNG35989.1 DUF2029 domain-containing protein [Nakamurella aerolata]
MTRGFRWVLLAASAALVVKVVLALTTWGSNDIGHWLAFVDAARQTGPVDIYAFPFDTTPWNGRWSFYNHPPLIGFYLQLVIWLQDSGIAPEVTIRVVSSLFDVAAALLVYALLRRRTVERAALAGGLAVALSPVLIIISGFHGNTDPMFMALVLAAVYLLADRRAAAWSGVCFALAVGVKVVPLVAGPVLLFAAWRQGRGVALRWLAGAGLTSAVFWLPAVLQHGRILLHNVFGYGGTDYYQGWGVGRLSVWVAGPEVWRTVAGGGTVVVVLCALLPLGLLVLLARRGVDGSAVLPGVVALSLAGFCLLTPTFGTQYLVWGVAPAVLLAPWIGAVFQLVAGGWLFWLYTRWSGGLPWWEAKVADYTTGQLWLGLLAWAMLLAAIVVGVRNLWRCHPRLRATSTSG